MGLTRNLQNISKIDTAIAGGKGASLGEMINADIPVPPGFVIFSSAFEKSLEETDLNIEIDSILHTANHKEMHTVENASEKIKALILGVEMPKNIADEIQKFFKDLGSKYVAVRSSATAEDSVIAAWAGQLESYLNTTEENLLENVKKCWASLFTPRAIFYRFEKNLHKQKISVAVVVQIMIESEKSGIAFSVHPVTQDKNQLIIEAGFGLGEAIVSGQITPDSYVVEKKPRRIIDKNVQTQVKGFYRAEKGGNEWHDIPKEIGEKQVLSDKEILELSEIILRIENHFGFPVDIEWAAEKGKFYIVQSRPITTLSAGGIKQKSLITLSKTHTREHSLLYGFIWQESDYKHITELWGHNIKNFLILFNPQTHKLEGWYDLAEFDDIYSWVVKQCNNHSDYFTLVKKRFYQHLNPMLPYLENKKEIRNLYELKKYYYYWLHWWSPMDSMILIPEFKVPSKIKKEALSIRQTTEHETDSLDQPVINFLIKKFPQYKELFNVILLDEIFLLDQGKLTAEQIKNIKKRKAGCAIFRNKIILMENLKDALAKTNLVFEGFNITAQKDELRGAIAYPGKVIGKVRLILHKKGISKLKKDEILVADMTSPNFIPAIRKAGAIITDEGGITCHAAIVAREMKIPCIIGTKIATEVLKDGDLVEVDADKGVVKIIKSKSTTTL